MVADDKIKCVENRTWASKFKGPLWIHAGGYSDVLEEETATLARYGIQIPYEYEYGGIVGVTEVVSCVRQHPSRWFTGPFAFVLKNSKPVEFFKMRGRLQLFETNLELGDLKEL